MPLFLTGAALMNLGGFETAGIVAGVTTVWHIAMYIGMLINKVKRLEDRVDGLDDDVKELRG